MGEEFVHDRIPKDLMEVLLSLASDWGDVINDPYKALQMTPLKGAMTNQVYHVSWPAKQENRFRKVLVRVYGEGVEVFFDRDDEIRTFECMSRHGQGPLLLGRFPDGRVEEFIHARTLSAADLRDPKISALIATKLMEFHNLDMPGPKIVVLWNRIRNWLNKAKSICSSEELKEFGLDTLEEDISLLEKELRKEDEDIGFCHNDLQYGNIMIDEETGQITIIDYEYASFNPVAYDLANHFCEMAADYHSDTPHILDYSKYPGVEERRRFISIYVNSGGGTKEANDAQVEELLRDSHEYTLANHLFWGLWGIISSYVNKIDFNYMEYARQRFHQYYKTRKLKKLGGSSSVSPLLED